MYLKIKFQGISDAKIKGVYVGPEIGELIQGAKFEDQLSEGEKNSMEIIKKCHYQFFGKSKGRKLL